jgi:hypothetical protein
MIRSDQKFSFKANIRLCSSVEINRLITTSVHRPKIVGNPFSSIRYTIKDVAIVEKSAATYRACECIVSSMINFDSKLVSMTHIVPDKNNMKQLDNIAHNIYYNADQLSKTGKTASGRIEGLIIGGKNNFIIERLITSFKNSSKLKDETINVFQKIDDSFGLDFSVIAMNKKLLSCADIFSDPSIDTHYVCIRDINGKATTTAKKLCKQFSDIRISTNDHVFNEQGEITEEIRNIIDKKSLRIFKYFKNRFF